MAHWMAERADEKPVTDGVAVDKAVEHQRNP